MEKKEFIDLIRCIQEARIDYSDIKNRGLPDTLKPWQYAAHGDIHDIPGGEEAWKKSEAERKAKEAEIATALETRKAKAAKDAEERASFGEMKDNPLDHVRTNGFGLSPEAHARAMEIVANIERERYSRPKYRAPHYDDLERHLIANGVSPNHPHIEKMRKDLDAAFDEDDRFTRDSTD